MERISIVIIGSGYAGIMAANRLAGHPEAGPRVRVRLITPSPRLDERIRLPRALSTGREPLVPLTELLHPRVGVVTGTAELIDREASIVRLSDGAAVPFHRVLIATGSRVAPPAGAFALDASADVGPLRRELERARREGTPVRVVGGGLAGMEIAAQIAADGLPCEIADAGQVGAALGPRARKRARAALARLGCVIGDGRRVAPEPGVVTVWAAGPAPVTVPCAPPLPVTPDGRIEVDARLRSPADARVLAAGDCAAAPGAHLRPSCATALALGACAAGTIAAEVLGRPAPAADAGYVMRCLSLGGRAGLIEPVRPDDTPRGPVLTGWAGGIVKDFVMNQTRTWLRGEARRSGSFRVPRGPRERSA